MATASKTYDVFLSHTSAHRELADEIASRLESAGLQAFHNLSLLSAKELSGAIWDALAECRALIAIISADTTPDAMGMVEIGAATAWNKPIYLILDGPPSMRIPQSFKSYRVYPRNRLDEVLQKILTEFEPLSDDERQLLANTYKDLNVPADRLSQSAKSLRDLTSRFNQKLTRNYPANASFLNCCGCASKDRCRESDVKSFSVQAAVARLLTGFRPSILTGFSR